MAKHPLEPLNADEFRQTATILRRDGHVRDSFRFASIELKEPLKEEVKAWRQGDAVPRTAFAVVLDRAENKTYEATVDLTGDSVVSFEHIAGVTPNFTVDEFHAVDEAMRKHPDVIAALAGRHDRHLGLEILEAVLEKRLDVLGQRVGVRLEPGGRLDDRDRDRLLVGCQEELVDAPADARRLSRSEQGDATT